MREADRGKCEERANAEERLRLRERGTRREEETACHARGGRDSGERRAIGSLFEGHLSRADAQGYAFRWLRHCLVRFLSRMLRREKKGFPFRKSPRDETG